MNSMRDVGFDANVITSYVSASASTLGDMVVSGAITADRPVYLQRLFYKNVKIEQMMKNDAPLF